VLTGGDGTDQFVLGASLSSSNLDAIEDFVTGTDKIVLSAKVFRKFTGSSAGSGITAGNLVLGAGATAVAKVELTRTVAPSATDILIVF